MDTHPGLTVEGLLRSGDFTYAQSDAVSNSAEGDYAEFTI